MSHDPQSPTDAADNEDDATIRQRAYDRGRAAHLAGELFREVASHDWQDGFTDSEDEALGVLSLHGATYLGPLTPEETAKIDASWERHKAAGPK